jgi:AraC-like DNA-binding protein
VGDSQLSVPAKVPFVFSLGQETARVRSQERIQLYLARDSFQGIATIMDAARGVVFETPEAHLFADYMVALERNLPNLRDADGPKLAHAIQAMVAACFAPALDDETVARAQLDFTRMERVRWAVSRNLRSPALGPDWLCREAATSRSQLYRLLQGEGGVAHYIQKRRLSESFSMLCDVSNRFSIGKVAEILCFADGSSFSRAFRREFGMSPSDVRAASLGGSAPPCAAKKGSLVDAEDFSHSLRNL